MKIPLLIILALSAFEIMAADFSVLSDPEADRQWVEAILDAEMKKNAPGSPAADFDFVDRAGKLHSLHDYIDGSTELMLIFFDPDCAECHQLADSLRSDTEVTDRIAAGDLHIVMITPIETDSEEWNLYAATLPPEWIVGYSPEGKVDTDSIYFLTHIPSIYTISPQGIILTRQAHSLLTP